MVNNAHDKKGRFAMRPIAKTGELKKAFCRAYAQLGTVTHACQQIGVVHATVDLWRTSDPEFVKEFEQAAVEYVHKLEREADRRGVEGIDKGIYYKGEKVDVEREYSDTLLIFRLKRLDPAYRERTEISGPGGGPILIKEVRIHAPEGP
jgi:hypothetical protein